MKLWFYLIVFVYSQDLNADPMTGLFEWAQKSGVSFTKTKISSNSMSNFEASDDISEGEVFITIPMDLVVKTATNPSENFKSVCQPIQKALKSLPNSTVKHVCRAVYLAKSKEVSQFYKNAFPSDLRMIPMFYEQQEIFILMGSLLSNAIADREDEMTAEFKAVKGISAFSDLAEKDYRYFRTIENMKNMQINIKGEMETILCPVGDSLILSENPNSTYEFNEKTKRIDFKSTKKIRKGELFSINWGFNSQFQSLMAYGITKNVFRDVNHYFRVDFVLDDGKALSFYLNWNFVPEDLVYQAKQQTGYKEEKQTIQAVFKALKDQNKVYEREKLAARVKDASLSTNPKNIYRVLYEEQQVQI